jgi:hypothetical protein
VARGFGQSWLFSSLVGISHGLTTSQNWSNPAHSVVHGRLPGLGISHFYALQLIKPCPLSSTWSARRLGISHFPFPSRVFWGPPLRENYPMLSTPLNLKKKKVYIYHHCTFWKIQILNLKKHFSKFFIIIHWVDIIVKLFMVGALCEV